MTAARSRDARRALGLTRPQYAAQVRPRNATPLRTIIDTLDAAGLDGPHWGRLAGRAHRAVRDVLRVLCHAQRSEPVGITARQLAFCVCLSEKHTRRCLHTLEALEIVQWKRATIDHTGRPQPGWIAVHVDGLAAAVRLAEARPWARG